MFYGSQCLNASFSKYSQASDTDAFDMASEENALRMADVHWRHNFNFSKKLLPFALDKPRERG